MLNRDLPLFLPPPRWTTWIRKASARWSTAHWGATATFSATCWPVSGPWAHPSQACWGRPRPCSRHWQRPPAWATARWVGPPGPFLGNWEPRVAQWVWCFASTFFWVASLWCTKGMKENEGFTTCKDLLLLSSLSCEWKRRGVPTVSGAGPVGAGCSHVEPLHGVHSLLFLVSSPLPSLFYFYSLALLSTFFPFDSFFCPCDLLTIITWNPNYKLVLEYLKDF